MKITKSYLRKIIQESLEEMNGAPNVQHANQESVMYKQYNQATNTGTYVIRDGADEYIGFFSMQKGQLQVDSVMEKVTKRPVTGPQGEALKNKFHPALEAAMGVKPKGM